MVVLITSLGKCWGRKEEDFQSDVDMHSWKVVTVGDSDDWTRMCFG